MSSSYSSHAVAKKFSARLAKPYVACSMATDTARVKKCETISNGISKCNAVAPMRCSTFARTSSLSTRINDSSASRSAAAAWCSRPAYAWPTAIKLTISALRSADSVGELTELQQFDDIAPLIDLQQRQPHSDRCFENRIVGSRNRALEERFGAIQTSRVYRRHRAQAEDRRMRCPAMCRNGVQCRLHDIAVSVFDQTRAALFEQPNYFIDRRRLARRR